MQLINVAEMKKNFSSILKAVQVSGEKFIIQYGRSNKKVAMIIPYDDNLEKKSERVFGIYKDKGSFKLADNFSMSDEQLLGL